MTKTVLIQASPRDPSSGVVVPVRLAGGGSKSYTQLGFTDWRSGIANDPKFTSAIGFGQAGLTGSVLSATATVRFFPSDRSFMSFVGNLFWFGASITVTVGDDATGVYATRLLGKVQAIAAADGAITLTVKDFSDDLAKPVCPDKFAGTGGVEGGAYAVGRVKRRSWGLVFNVEGLPLDTANNIYEFGDPNRPINAFVNVKDKGRVGVSPVVVAWAGSVAATLAALIASTPPQGGASIAPSIACVKWWTVPSGPLTADLQGEIGAGYVNTAPTISARVVATYSTLITIANLSDAQGWSSALAGWHINDDSTTAAQLLDLLLLPISITWVLNSAGSIVFRRLTWSNPVEALSSFDVERSEVFQPLKTRHLGFEKNYRVHTDAEISAALILSGVDTDATRNDDGANMIPSPVLLDQVQLSSGAILEQTTNSTGRPADYRRALLKTPLANVRWHANLAVPCRPGDTLWYSDVIMSDTSSTDTSNVSVSFYKPNGDPLTAFNLSSTTAVTMTQVNGVWTQRLSNFVVPDGAAFVQPYAERPSGNVGTFYVGEPYLSRVQPGADVTTIVTVPDLTILANSAGVIAANQLPATITPIVRKGPIDSRTSLSVTYALANLSANLMPGGTPALTVSNANDSTRGQITVGTAITGPGTYQLIPTVDGIVRPAVTGTIIQKNAAASTGGGGGGGGSGGSGSGPGTKDMTGTSIPASATTLYTFTGVTVPSGQSLRATWPASYYVNSGVSTKRSAAMTAKWQYSPAGAATWTDFGPAITGSAAFDWPANDSNGPGSANVNQTASVSAGNYDVQLVAGRTGTVLNMNISDGIAALSVS